LPVRDEVLNWLAEARADLRHAEASTRIGDYSWACFAAQQAAERAIRSYHLGAGGLHGSG